jgi:hypothetical protein
LKSLESQFTAPDGKAPTTGADSDAAKAEPLAAVKPRQQDTSSDDTADEAPTPPLAAGGARRRYVNILRAAEAPCPSKLRLRIRVTDFWPLQLKDCAVLRCDECHTL